MFEVSSIPHLCAKKHAVKHVRSVDNVLPQITLRPPWYSSSLNLLTCA